jgi:hypothetical protein
MSEEGSHDTNDEDADQSESDTSSSIDEQEHTDDDESGEVDSRVQSDEVVESAFLDDLIIRLMTAPIKQDTKALKSGKKKQ